MTFYLGIHLALAAVFLLVRVVLSVAERRAVGLPFGKQLFISRALLCATLIATMGAMWFVRQADLSWSLGVASFADAHAAGDGTLAPFSGLSVASIHIPGAGRFSPLISLLLAALLAVALLETLRTILQYRELAAVLRSSVILRHHRRTVIVVSDRIGVPFSLRTLRSRWVVLPNHLLGNRKDLRLAICHELQHHRQGDTSWGWISRALCIVFWPNPVVHLWRRWHHGVQELACDEALCERPGFKVEEYARCLLHVAERALAERQAFQFAPSMAAREAVTHLQKRIEMLFASRPRRLSQPLLATALAVAMCCGVCVSALAAGLTAASRENRGDAAAKGAAEEMADAPSSSAVERGTTSTEPDCAHYQDSRTESLPALLSSSSACTTADEVQHSRKAADTPSTATAPDCSEPSLDCRAASAVRN